MGDAAATGFAGLGTAAGFRAGARAAAASWAALLIALKASGAIPTLPNFASATQPFGAYITLDGIHPSALAHAVLANLLIQTINTKYSVAIDTVPR